ncbi:extracellular solute-binding protein [Paenibacillus elgii]|uniref:extracellular solute-binding protein n=1 Tax=Paenibacillus elgii TaxID=189691 RepID=UPI00203BA2D9|nr:extracellular solute-binding protein [Paenibacillus elgii]MCM3272862.1 extracellular solute-binding protein [Paenibacillus elgii]
MNQLGIRLKLLLCLICLLTGCTSLKPEDKATKLKVFYHDKLSFYKIYGKLFTAQNPHVEIEVVSLDDYYKKGFSMEGYRELVKKEQPDLIFNFDLQSFVEDGMLVDLEPLLKKSKDVNLERMNKNMTAYLRNKGGGRLYGLSPTFQSKALFYNKTLFDQFGIRYPTDHMSWEEVFQLAARFAKAERNNGSAYGYYPNISHPFRLVQNIAETEGLSLTDTAGQKIMINTPSWRRIMDMVFSRTKEGTVYINQPGDMQKGNLLIENPFIQGRAAMTVEYSYELEYLSTVDFEWGIATEPVNPAAPDRSTSLTLNELFGIYSGSQNIDGAWQLLEYIHSEKFAKLNSRAGSHGSLPAYIDSMQKKDNNMEAFFKLYPQDAYTPSVPYKFSTEFYEQVQQSMTRVIEGELELDSMLMELEKIGQFKLDQALKK